MPGHYQVPDRFRDAVIDAHVRIEIAGEPAQELERGIVVEAGFAAAYTRACVFGEVERVIVKVLRNWLGRGF